MTPPKKETQTVSLIAPKDRINDSINPLSGSKSSDFTNVLARQVMDSLWVKHSDKEELGHQIQAALVGVMGAAPQDEIEGMLAAQMVALHNASMECFRRAMLSEQTFEGRRENLNHANKLTRSYAAMMEALSRYRGKGQQKMTVEHVHVHAGGQAIVGNVTRPEGGGGIAIKNEEQPNAPKETRQPELEYSAGQSEIMPPVRSQDTQRKAMPIPRHA